MEILLLLVSIFLAAPGFAGETVTTTSSSTATETSTWKRVDKSLSDGVRTAKSKLMEDDKAKKDAPEKTPEAKKEKGDLDKVTDSLNDAWDGVLHGAGKVLKTQQTGSATSTSTVTK